MVSVNHQSLTYMVTSISNYAAAIVVLGLIFNKMHHYAAHYLPSQILRVQLFSMKPSVSVLILNWWND